MRDILLAAVGCAHCALRSQGRFVGQLPADHWPHLRGWRTAVLVVSSLIPPACGVRWCSHRMVHTRVSRRAPVATAAPARGCSVESDRSLSNRVYAATLQPWCLRQLRAGLTSSATDIHQLRRACMRHAVNSGTNDHTCAAWTCSPHLQLQWPYWISRLGSNIRIASGDSDCKYSSTLLTPYACTAGTHPLPVQLHPSPSC